MKMRQIRAVMLQDLYRHYEQHGIGLGPTLSSFAEFLPGVHSETLRAVLRDFQRTGVVAFTATLGETSGIHLTPRGVEQYEDPASELAPLVQQINVSGGQVQIGDGNVQNITFQLAFSSMEAVLEAAPNFSAKHKRQLSAALNELGSQPAAQKSVHPILTAPQANRLAQQAMVLCVRLGEEHLLELGPAWTRLDVPRLEGAVLYRHDERSRAAVAWLNSRP